MCAGEALGEGASAYIKESPGFWEMGKHTSCPQPLEAMVAEEPEGQSVRYCCHSHDDEV